MAPLAYLPHSVVALYVFKRFVIFYSKNLLILETRSKAPFNILILKQFVIQFVIR